MPFAIRVCEENSEKMLEVPSFDEEALGRALTRFGDRSYALVRGYVDSRGKVLPHVVLPMFVIRRRYECDEIKMETDWDQIVAVE